MAAETEDQHDDYLSDGDMKRLMLVAVYSGEGQSVPEAAVLALVNWGRKIRIEQAMLETVLGGRIRATYEARRKGGKRELLFRESSGDWGKKLQAAIRAIGDED